MASFLDDIAKFLADEGLGTVDQNIHAGSLPDEPDLCTAVNGYGGGSPNGAFNTPGLFDEMPGLQVRARAGAWDRVSAESRCYAAFLALPKIQGVVLQPSGVLYRMVRPQQSPFLLERDSKNRCVFVVNFLCEKEMSAA